MGRTSPIGLGRPHIGVITSAGKCELVLKPHANPLDTQVNLNSAPKYFLILPGPLGDLQSALGHCRSILRYSWKSLQLWRCMQNATIFGLEDVQLFKRLKPPCRYAIDFQSSWDVCVALRETIYLVLYSDSSSSWGSITTCHVVNDIRLCYSHRICYSIVWHVLSFNISLYIYIWSLWLQVAFKHDQRSIWRHQLRELGDILGGHDCVNLEMQLETMMERVWTCWQEKGKVHIWCGSAECTDQTGKSVYPHHWLDRREDRHYSLRQRIEYHHWILLQIHLKAMTEHVGRCTPSQRLSALSDVQGGHYEVKLETHLDAIIKRVYRCAWKPRLR